MKVASFAILGLFLAATILTASARPNNDNDILPDLITDEDVVIPKVNHKKDHQIEVIDYFAEEEEEEEAVVEEVAKVPEPKKEVIEELEEQDYEDVETFTDNPDDGASSLQTSFGIVLGSCLLLLIRPNL